MTQLQKNKNKELVEMKKVSLNEAAKMLGCSRTTLTNAIYRKVACRKIIWPTVWVERFNKAAKAFNGKPFPLEEANRLLDRQVFLDALQEALAAEISKDLGRGRPKSRVSEISIYMLCDGLGIKIDCLEPSCLMQVTEERRPEEGLASTNRRALEKWSKIHGHRCPKKHEG